MLPQYQLNGSKQPGWMAAGVGVQPWQGLGNMTAAKAGYRR